MKYVLLFTENLEFLGAFVELRKETIRFVMSAARPPARPPTRLHDTTGLPLDGFSWSSIFDYFSKKKTVAKILVPLKSDENKGYFTWRPGPCSSVGIATELPAGRSGIEFRWERDFPPVQSDPGAHPASCTIGTGSFPGVNCGRGVLLTTHALLVSRSRKSRAIPLPTLWITPVP